MKISVPARLLEALNHVAHRPKYLDLLGSNQKQLAFVQDKSKRRTALCGRRGGKTTAIAVWLYDGMLTRPGTQQVYIGMTRGVARRILWDGVMAKLSKRLGWKLRETSVDGQLIIRHENGSTLWIAGCDNKSEVDKFRGQAYFRVAIDEAQSFPEDVLQLLVEDAIEPALADENGELALTGTPSPLDAGYFYAATTGQSPGWSSHHWDIRDNPLFQQPANDNRFADRAAEVLNQAAGNLGSEASPTYQREWLGKWVHDAAALIYPFSGANLWQPNNPNHPYGLPEGEYAYGLGVDLGFGERSTAFVKVAKRVDSGQLYVLKAYTRSRMIPTAVAAHVQALREQLRKETGQALIVVVDEGALGKGYAEQMRVMGVGCEAAEKTEKRAYQEYVGGLIRTVAVLVHATECTELTQECSKLQFDPETGKEDERYRRHCADGFLYIARRLFPRYNPELVEPVFGSPEWRAAQARKMREEAIKEAKQRQAKARAARR